MKKSMVFIRGLDRLESMLKIILLGQSTAGSAGLRKTWGWISLVLITICVPPVSYSQNFDSGLEAYQRGDYTKAYGKWYLSSLEGHVVAKANLGVLYMEGLGVLQNHRKAYELLSQAAQMGIPFAQFNLALMYEKGRGIPQDRARAHMWYNLAASNGHQPAITARANVARYMTAPSILVAEELASKCLEGGYQDC